MTLTNSAQVIIDAAMINVCQVYLNNCKSANSNWAKFKKIVYIFIAYECILFLNYWVNNMLYGRTKVEYSYGEEK